jgi:hypothetical protein
MVGDGVEPIEVVDIAVEQREQRHPVVADGVTERGDHLVLGLAERPEVGNVVPQRRELASGCTDVDLLIGQLLSEPDGLGDRVVTRGGNDDKRSFRCSDQRDHFVGPITKP